FSVVRFLPDSENEDSDSDFPEEEVEVVSSSWIPDHKAKDHCFWPPKKLWNRASILATDHQEPDLETWTLHRIAFDHDYKSVYTARQNRNKVAKNETCSTEMSDSGPLRKKRKSKMPSRFLDSPEEHQSIKKKVSGKQEIKSVRGKAGKGNNVSQQQHSSDSEREEVPPPSVNVDALEAKLNNLLAKRQVSAVSVQGQGKKSINPLDLASSSSAGVVFGQSSKSRKSTHQHGQSSKSKKSTHHSPNSLKNSSVIPNAGSRLVVEAASSAARVNVFSRQNKAQKPAASDRDDTGYDTPVDMEEVELGVDSSVPQGNVSQSDTGADSSHELQYSPPISNPDSSHELQYSPPISNPSKDTANIGITSEDSNRSDAHNLSPEKSNDNPINKPTERTKGTSRTSADKAEELNPSVVALLFEKLEELSIRQKRIMGTQRRMISYIVPEEDLAEEDIDELPDFPIDDVDGFEELESILSLKQNRQNFVKMLVALPFNEQSEKYATGVMLKEVITNRLSRLVSWGSTQGSKLCFKKSQCYKGIQIAILKLFPQSKLTICQQKCQIWFNTSNQRTVKPKQPKAKKVK
ncbi:hypothetical protein FOCC_FOCC012841, partial [Frankliniella occidentalis]